MQDIVGILLMFMGTASGLLFQDPVVCRFTESNQCYVAFGQQLHLKMPRVDMFHLKITDKTFTDRIILKYRHHHGTPLRVYIKRWQFVNDTLILTSAERSDYGTYTLQTFDANGNNKGIYTLQLNIEAEVTSVKVSYSCLSPLVWRVYCSADGDNLSFSWSSGFVTWFENGSSTLVLDKIHKANVTCHVKNHVSHDSDSVNLQKCPDLARNKMQDIVGILLMFMGAASGLLVQDPVVCRFKESNQCYVALGQQLHLQMPRVGGFNLTITDKTATDHIIFEYHNCIPQEPYLKGWTFFYDNKTMILTSAARSDYGTYTLQTFDANRTSTGSYALQVNIEAEVTSVKVSYSCLSPLVWRVYCSADGDNLSFSWSSGFVTWFENGSSTLVLDKIHKENVTCHVQNHVSHDSDSVNLKNCPEYTLNILGYVCMLLVMPFLLFNGIAFYVYRKKQALMKKEAQSQDDKEIANVQVDHLPLGNIATSPAQAQGDTVEHAAVVTNPSQRIDV